MPTFITFLVMALVASSVSIATVRLSAAEVGLPLIGSWPGYIRDSAKRVDVAGDHAYVTDSHV